MKDLHAPESQRRRRRWLGALAAVAAGAVVAVALRRTSERRDRLAAPNSGAATAPDRSFPGAGPPHPSQPGAPAPAPGLPSGGGTAEEARSERDQRMQRVQGAIDEWRAAIGRRDADTVEALNRAFLSSPSEFTGALMASAESDPDERVRAFSTRVLGKLRAPATAELLRKLLADASPYVRQNAAWALGQLGDRSAGPLLRRNAGTDPDPAVRQAAGEALRNIDRGGGR